MALLTKTRSSAPPPEFSDDVVRTCVVWNKATSTREIWVEWEVELPGGKIATKSARCDAQTEADILALPNFGTGLQMAADNTHPKVTT